MSELINNIEQRKARLKELILALHHGTPEEEVRTALEASFRQVPYGEVVAVEQELRALTGEQRILSYTKTEKEN